MLIKLGRRGQSTAEYAILFGLVVGALVAMQVYIRRGLQGRVKDAVDFTGSGGTVAGDQMVFSGTQYEPYYTISSTQNQASNTKTEDIAEGGAVTRSEDAQSTANREATTGWFGYIGD